MNCSIWRLKQELGRLFKWWILRPSFVIDLFALSNKGYIASLQVVFMTKGSKIINLFSDVHGTRWTHQRRSCIGSMTVPFCLDLRVTRPSLVRMKRSYSKLSHACSFQPMLTAKISQTGDGFSFIDDTIRIFEPRFCIGRFLLS